MGNCEICRKMVDKRIKLPTNTGDLVCYDCFYWWQEDIPCKELKKRFKEHYKE